MNKSKLPNNNIADDVKRILNNQTELLKKVQFLIENANSQPNSEPESNKGQLEELRAECDNALKKKNDELASTKKVLDDANATIERKDNELKAANATIEKKDSELKAANASIERKESELKAANASIERKESELKAANATIERKDNELKAANATIEDKMNALKSSETTILTLKAEHDKLQAEYDLLKKANDEEQKIRQPYSEAFRLFQELPPEMRENMRGILRGENVNQFIFVGMQEENIGRLWDFCANEAKRKSEHTEKLSKIFWFLFEKCQQQLHDSPTYEKATIAVGDKFDEDLSTRDGDSAPLGKISKIWLYGYNRCIGNKVVKKSIVHVDKD